MEEAQKPFNDQEKKMVVKIGGVGGCGIGAVILLGGALASAALASAFIVRKKERSSGKNRRPRCQNPPQDETSKGKEFNFTDATNSDVEKFPSSEAKTEDLDVKSEKDTTELLLVGMPGIEINGGTSCDVTNVEESEQILCSISPKKEEIDTVPDGFTIISDEFRLSDGKFSKDVMLTEEDFTNEISKESGDFEQVCIDKEMTEGEIVEGEIETVDIIETQTRKEGNIEVLYCDQEESEITLVDKAVEEHIDQMEANKYINMEVKGEEIELVCSCENGEIGEVKNEELAMEENESDLDIEVAVVDNVVEGVHTDQTEVKIKEKELEGCGNENGKINGVKFEVLYGDQEESEITIVDKAVEENIDQMEVEKNLKGELKSEEIELVCTSDNGEIGEVKYKEAMEENESDLAIEVAVVDNGAVEDVDIDQIEEKELEGCCNEDGEIKGVKIGETIQETKVDLAKFGTELSEEETYDNQEFTDINSSLPEIIVSDSLNQETPLLVVSDNQEPISGEAILSETIVSESLGEDGQIALLPVLDRLSIEHEENVKDFEEDFVKEVIQEDEVKQIEEDFVKGHRKEFYQVDDEIVQEEREEVGLKGEDNQSFLLSDMQIEVNEVKTETPSENKEENVCIDYNPTPEMIQFEDSDVIVQNLAIPMPKEEPISVGNEDATNEEVPEGFDVCQPKDQEVDDENIIEETEESSETIEIDNATETEDLIMEMNENEEKDEEDNTKDYNDEANETDLSDEVDESSSVGTGDSSLESNSEPVWPAMKLQQVKLTEQEVIGKVQEDKAVKKGNDFKEQFKTESQKTIMENYLKEMPLPTNSTKWRMVIATLSVLSTVSCSWFFGLSFVKLCLIVFFTMVLSKIHGYWIHA